MGLFSDFSRAWTWFTKVFVSHIVSAAPVAVTITEMIKALLANPVTGFLANIADAVFSMQLPTNVANLAINAINQILAVELGIEGLPANPTPDQILAFETAILKTFDISSNNSKLYTLLGAQVYGIIQTNIAKGTTNFGSWVIAIEQIYALYKKDLAANATVANSESTQTQSADVPN